MSNVSKLYVRLGTPVFFVMANSAEEASSIINQRFAYKEKREKAEPVLETHGNEKFIVLNEGDVIGCYNNSLLSAVFKNDFVTQEVFDVEDIY